MIVANMTAAAVASLALSGSFAVAASSPTPAQRVREVVHDRSDSHLLVAVHLGRHEISVWVARPTLTCLEGGQRDVAALPSLGQALCSCGRRAGYARPPSDLAASSNHGQAWTTHALYGYRQLRNLLGTQVAGQVQMFALDSGHAIQRRTNGGTRWSAVAGIRADALQTSTGRLFAAASAGVRTSACNGATWSQPGSPALPLLARDNAAHGSLAGIDGAGKVRKYCGGTWFAQGTALEDPHTLTTIESGGHLTLIVATENGLQRSPDWGTRWMDVATW